MSKPQVLGLIPARGGSKGIQNKNIRLLAGKPLIAHTAGCALASGVCTRLVVSTDSEEIAAVAARCGVEVPFLRPAELAQDTTPMMPVIQHAIRHMEESGWKPDAVILLQPTAPLRRPEHLQQAVALFHAGDCDSVVGVSPVPGHYHPYWNLVVDDGVLREFHPGGLRTTRRQDLPPVYSRDGSLYLFTRDLAMEQGTIYGQRCRPLFIEPEDSVNLDSMEDWERAAQRLEQRPPAQDSKR